MHTLSHMRQAICPGRSARRWGTAFVAACLSPIGFVGADAAEFVAPEPGPIAVTVDAGQVLEAVNREVLGVCLVYSSYGELVPLFGAALEGASVHVWSGDSPETVASKMAFAREAGISSRYLFVEDHSLGHPARYRSPEDNNLKPSQQPAQRAELIRRLNGESYPGFPDGYGINRVSVWDEPQFPQNGAWPPEDFARYVVDVSRAVRAVDPAVEIGMGVHEDDPTWNERMFREVARLDIAAVRFIDHHPFSFAWQQRQAEIGDYYARMAEVEVKRRLAGQKVEQATRLGRGHWRVDALAWAIHPQGYGAPFNPTTDMGAALHVASMYGMFWEERVHAAHFFHLASRGTNDVHFVMAQRGGSGVTLRPAGEVLKLYGELLHGWRVQSSLESTRFRVPGSDLEVPLVLAHAFRDDERGRLVTMLINKHETSPAEVTLELSQWVSSTGEAQLVSLVSEAADSLSAERRQQAVALSSGPNPTVQFELPPHSVHALVVPGTVLGGASVPGVTAIPSVRILGIEEPGAVSPEAFLAGEERLSGSSDFEASELAADALGIVHLASLLDRTGRRAEVAKGFSGEASAWVFAPAKGDYDLSVASFGRASLFVNDRLVAKDLGSNPVEPERSLSVPLDAGWNDVRVRMVSTQQGMAVRLGLVNALTPHTAATESAPSWPLQWAQMPTVGATINLEHEPREAFVPDNGTYALAKAGKGRRHAVLRWELPSLSASQVSKVKARIVFARGWSQGQGSVWVNELTGPWTLETLTTQTMPPLADPLGRRVPASEEFWVFEGPAVDALVRRWLRRPESNHGLAVSTDVAEHCGFFSGPNAKRGGTRVAPRLELSLAADDESQRSAD